MRFQSGIAVAALCAAFAIPATAASISLGFSEFASDTHDSFEGIGAALPGPNFGVLGFRGPITPAFTTGTGLHILGSGNYIGDWALGPANSSSGSSGYHINNASEVPDGTAYLLHQTATPIAIVLPDAATRFGFYIGGSTSMAQFDMYLGTTLVDSYSSVIGALTWVGWQSDATFDRVEWAGTFSGFDFVSYDTAAVPEPVTLALLGIGLAGLGFARRKRML